MTAKDPIQSRPSLRHFPVAFFAVLMGLWGWVLALQAGADYGALSTVFARIPRWGAVVATFLVFGAYLYKGLRWPRDCLAEWQTPPKLAFFPAASIALMLMSSALKPSAPEIAAVLWPIAATLQGGLALAVISSWISHRAFQIGHLNPAWFIPAVGNVIVPIGGVPLGYVEISWLFFSGGVVFWIVLLTLVMNRLMFHDPLPERLLPTLVIMVAPPAVAFLGYEALTGQADAFGRVLLNAAYVFALLVLIQGVKFAKLPFALSWWALSFPVAGLTLASFRFATVSGVGVYGQVGYVGLALLSLFVSGLILKTTSVLLAGGFTRPEA